MFDLHVHAGPDVVNRAGDDVDTVARYEAAGFWGCVLKGHYDTTTGRAAAAARGSTVDAFGGVTLNQHVGGVNPAAVAAALDMGARVVWMPTADAHTQRAAGLPRLCGEHPGLAGDVYATPPVDWSTAGAVRQICRLVADTDAVLATGHLSAPEVSWLLATARRQGVRRLLMTHPSFVVPAMSAAQAAELADRGAYVELTAYQLFRQPGCDAAMLAAFAREVGLDRVVLSSDAGHPEMPPPPEALAHLIDALAHAGLDRGALDAATADTPAALVTPG